MKKTVTILSLVLLLSACSTPYPDTRSPEVQKN